MLHIFASYPTFLVFLAIVFAIAVTMVLMPAWIKFLKSSHIGQQVRADGPESHLVKQGTPTMGGVIMLVAVIAYGAGGGPRPRPRRSRCSSPPCSRAAWALSTMLSKVVKERSAGSYPESQAGGPVPHRHGLRPGGRQRDWASPPRSRSRSSTRSTWACSPRTSAPWIACRGSTSSSWTSCSWACATP